MKEIDIIFRSVDDVVSFINTVSCFQGKVRVCSDMYEIDARSVVGIFSLDLKKPFVLKIEEWKEVYIPLLDKYFYGTEKPGFDVKYNG